jgi:hypothetical protein
MLYLPRNKANKITDVCVVRIDRNVALLRRGKLVL